MTDDLIARLQKREHHFRHAVEGEYDANLMMKARFAIEALTSERDEARAILKFIAGSGYGTRKQRQMARDWLVNQAVKAAAEAIERGDYKETNDG